MLLSDFSDRVNRRQWIYAGLVVLGLISFVLLIQFTGRDRSHEAVEKSIRKSEMLSRVDQLCRDLPKPKDFQFVNKQITGNSLEAALSFYFNTDLSYKEIQAFYLEWFNANGWTNDNGSNGGDLWFRKNHQKIYIGLATTTDYAISCAEDVYKDL